MVMVKKSDAFSSPRLMRNVGLTFSKFLFVNQAAAQGNQRHLIDMREREKEGGRECVSD